MDIHFVNLICRLLWELLKEQVISPETMASALENPETTKDFLRELFAPTE